MADKPYKLGIIGAMDLEVEALMERVENPRLVERAHMMFCEGTVDGTPVVIAKCGVGKVAAGMCVQIMLDLFGVTHIVNTGVAGSLDAKIDIGDLVVSTDAIYHDVDVTALGYNVGQIPGIGTLTFPADETLQKAVTLAAEQGAPDIKVFHGRVVSGDTFVDSIETKAILTMKFGGLCCEMEGAAVAQACFVNDIPYVIVRAISDKADGSAEMVYSEFEASSAKRCAAVVQQLIENGL